MRPAAKIILGLVILLVAFDGLRIVGAASLGEGASIILAIIGVLVPLAFGIAVRRSGGLSEAVANSAVTLWPLCVMRIWPFIAAEKAWGYSYTLSASEKEVAGFILYLVALSAWSILSARSLSKGMKDAGTDENKKSNPAYGAWLGVAIGFIFILAVTLRFALTRHGTFHSKAWDLAIFNQLAYNMLHGNGLEVSVRSITNIMSDHFSPIMFPVAIIGRIFGGDAKALIIIQAVAVATGLIPIALIAARRNPANSILGIFPAIIYALYAPLTFLLLDDFHPIAFVVPLFLWAFYFLEIKRMWPFYIFLILAGSCQEEGWIIVGMVGIYLAIFRGMRLAGIVVLILSWGFFFFLVLFLIPSFRPEGDYFYIHRYGYLGSSAGEIINNIFLHPGRWIGKLFDARSIAFILMMLAPLGFLPLRRPKMLFILIPVAFYTLISGYDIQRSVFHQYTAPFIPFLMLAMLDNFGNSSGGKINPAKMQLAAGGLWCAICATVMMLLFPIGGFPEIYSNAGRSSFDAKLDSHFVGLIPGDAKICTISKYAPHLANRRYLTLFPDLGWNGEWADVILIDGKELITRDDRQKLAELLYGGNDGPKYELSHFYNGVFLFKPASKMPPFSRTISASMPGTDNLMQADGGELYQVGGCESGDLVPFTAGSHEIEQLVYDIQENLYWLKLMMKVSWDFDHTWFFAVRIEDEEGNPLYVHHHFPRYGPFYDRELNPGETRTVKPFNRGKWKFPEAYVIDLRTHKAKPGQPIFGGRVGPPARMRILPMQLPADWTNTLDEYVTSNEQTGDVFWDRAYVVELGDN